ncbi:DMT family transporter [Candidatus Pelagibacter sp.]|nr:DMT family transporter [Candidatus Pelagibacter sp.]
MIKIFPLTFIILWSSAFVTTKPIIDNSDPFAALAFRFFFVALGFFIFSIYTKQNILVNKKNFFQSFFSGVLFHGVYLGGVFYSVSIGMPTGIAALIVTLQPILTNALAGKFLGEKVSYKQWIGVILGFIGAALVLGFDIGTSLPAIGVVASFIALLAITTSTLWQKKNK